VFGGVEHFAEILLRTLAAGISCRFMGTSHEIGRNGNVPISSIPPGTEKAGGMNHATIDPSSMKCFQEAPLPSGSPRQILTVDLRRINSNLEDRSPKAVQSLVFGAKLFVSRMGAVLGMAGQSLSPRCSITRR
jgi:hypothetical protein